MSTKSIFFGVFLGVPGSFLGLLAGGEVMSSSASSTLGSGSDKIDSSVFILSCWISSGLSAILAVGFRTLLPNGDEIFKKIYFRKEK